MEITLEDLFDLLEGLVGKREDGHLTVMRFSTGWKAMAGTPDLDTGKGRKQVGGLEMHKTLKDALIALIRSYTRALKR